MNKILDYLEPYDFCNNLLPGMIFMGVCSWLNTPNLTINLDEPLFYVISYVVGLIMSRLGSLVLERYYKKRVKFKPYGNYIAAERVDSKIQILMSRANFYRTLTVTSFVMVLTQGISLVSSPWVAQRLYVAIIAFGCVVLFWFSYKKQIGYVRDRVKKVGG